MSNIIIEVSLMYGLTKHVNEGDILEPVGLWCIWNKFVHQDY